MDLGGRTTTSSKPIRGAYLAAGDTLSPAARAEWRGAATSFGLAVLSATLVVLAFGWDPGRMAAGAALGTLVWGAVMFAFVFRRGVPRGPLPVAPAEHPVQVESPWRPATAARMLTLAVVACAGLAWLADRWELGGFFIPGQLFGYAAAHAATATLIRRWERAHGEQVLTSTDEEGRETLWSRPHDR